MLKAKEFDSVKNKGCPFRLPITELLKEAKSTFAITFLGKPIQLLFHGLLMPNPWLLTSVG
jgi:hypothetical protein